MCSLSQPEYDGSYDITDDEDHSKPTRSAKAPKFNTKDRRIKPDRYTTDKLSEKEKAINVARANVEVDWKNISKHQVVFQAVVAAYAESNKGARVRYLRTTNSPSYIMSYKVF